MPLQPSLASGGKGICLLSFGKYPPFVTPRPLTRLIDAGGTRAVSQLTILAQLMHRLNYGTTENSLNRPHTIFDMIGGVGSGGFIAVLLVIFGLTVEEALEEFTDLSVNVIDRQNIDADTRTTNLNTYVDNLFMKYKMDKDLRLLDANVRSKGCKLAVPVSSKTHAGSIHVLRNYSSYREQTPNLTVVEAILATLATPPLFTSTQIRKDAATFEYIGADWTLGNPTQEIIIEAHEAFGAEAKVACLLSLGCGHPGVFTISDNSASAELGRLIEHLALDAERKAQSIDSQMERLGTYYRYSVSNGLERTSSTKIIGPGEITAHTKVYLDDPQMMRRTDACVDTLRLREGVSSLDQLRYTGDRTSNSPRLPPLTKTFVMRKKPWEFIEKILLAPQDPNDGDDPRMLFITGIGGCGKTQLMLKFMKEKKSQFAYQFFIDGSSEDRIRADIIRNVRALGTEHAQKGFEDCLIFLAYPRDGRSLLVYDNVDDPNIDLSSLLPHGASCLIAITSRNCTLGYLQPESHLQLDVMSLDEASDLLLHGLNILAPISDTFQEDIHRLAQTLGRLPIALQQACAYMRQTKCLAEEYIERLSTSRRELLGRAMKIQINMQSISTHAAFETSFVKLPTYSRQMLRLLSQFHWNGFPLELVKMAAENQFLDFKWTSLERDGDSYIGKRFLEDIFLRNGEWKVTNLDDIIVSLENYSLVTTVHGVDTLLLQVHPLLHEWVRTYAVDDQHNYESAAIFLLALGARNEYTAATQYLASHVTHMAAHWDHLHINDAIAFGSLLSHNSVHRGALRLQKRVVEELRRTLKSDENDLSNSLWDLALTHSALRQFTEAEVLQEEVLAMKRGVLGERHPRTLSAASNLALTYGKSGKLKEAESLQKNLLKMSKEILGEGHPDTVTALNNLASTYYRLESMNEAKGLFEEVVKHRMETLGDRHPHTISASSNLALTYRKLGKLEEAKLLQEEVLKTREIVLGARNPSTVKASKNLAITLRMLNQLTSIESLRYSVYVHTSQENSHFPAHNSVSTRVALNPTQTLSDSDMPNDVVATASNSTQAISNQNTSHTSIGAILSRRQRFITQGTASASINTVLNSTTTCSSGISYIATAARSIPMVPGARARQLYPIHAHSLDQNQELVRFSALRHLSTHQTKGKKKKRKENQELDLAGNTSQPSMQANTIDVNQELDLAGITSRPSMQANAIDGKQELDLAGNTSRPSMQANAIDGNQELDPGKVIPQPIHADYGDQIRELDPARIISQRPVYANFIDGIQRISRFDMQSFDFPDRSWEAWLSVINS
ncbi:hypothetical protein M408DRAFT_27516 [Serendipita vermifera MAFF 305830]|uniref:PNPLA domain-containing protein n=1 Tax=Serendipita vermifera MAFF 305830 TaxID=933852 RepID=A0A0C3AXF5_SERVB|nr:hypothetical protein M408DRAFT_27516 [Serendipita vermifera MAFF 305830]